jgi:small subunit ribosomal protein S17
MATAKKSTESSADEQAKKKRGLETTQEGYVTSNKMDKTVVVSIVSFKKHPSYKKYVRRTKKYAAHDERNECQVGDLVRIVETRPMSKTKRWRVQKVLEQAV